MAKQRSKPVPARNRVMLSFTDRERESLAQLAQEARLPIATYVKILLLKQLDSARVE